MVRFIIVLCFRYDYCIVLFQIHTYIYTNIQNKNSKEQPQLNRYASYKGKNKNKTKKLIRIFIVFENFLLFDARFFNKISFLNFEEV